MISKITNANSIGCMSNATKFIPSFGRIDNIEDSFEKQNRSNVENNGFLTSLKQKADDLYYITTQKAFHLLEKNFFKAPYNDEKIEICKELALEFQKTPEGIRRKNMTDKEIESEVKKTFNEIMKELEIPKEQYPYIIVENEENMNGAVYDINRHVITFNSFHYRNGLMDPEQIIMHEATHLREAILRAGIPQNRIDEIIENELTSKIKNGDNYAVSVSNANVIQPPKLPNEMKTDFIRFSKENLYDKSFKFRMGLVGYGDELKKTLDKNPDETEFYNKISWINKKILKLLDKNNKIPNIENELKNMINKYPEFKKQYKSEGEALNHLVQYSISQIVRYQDYTDTKVGAGMYIKSSGINVEKLSGDKLKTAEQSLINSIKLKDDTVNYQTKGDKTSYNFYKYTPEEVLADTNGHEFYIKKLNQKYEQMKKNGSLSKQDETYLTLKIKQSKLEIQRLKLGEKVCKMILELNNNPNNKELEQEIKNLGQKGANIKKEVEKIKVELTQIRPE